MALTSSPRRWARSSSACATLAAFELLDRGAGGRPSRARPRRAGRGARAAHAVGAPARRVARRRSPARSRRREDRRRDRRRRLRDVGVTWLIRNWDQVLVALGEHITIALTALAIAFAIALPIGIWAARSDRVFAIVDRAVRISLHHSHARVPCAADPDRRPRAHQRDHLHGGVLADDPDPQRCDRAARSTSRRRRRGARHGHERAATAVARGAAARAAGHRRGRCASRRSRSSASPSSPRTSTPVASGR